MNVVCKCSELKQYFEIKLLLKHTVQLKTDKLRFEVGIFHCCVKSTSVNELWVYWKPVHSKRWKHYRSVSMKFIIPVLSCHSAPDTKLIYYNALENRTPLYAMRTNCSSLIICFNNIWRYLNISRNQMSIKLYGKQRNRTTQIGYPKTDSHKYMKNENVWAW